MTSVLSSLFTSASTQIANRVEDLRAAEASLMEHARNRFISIHDKSNYHLELVDTRIPRAAVPIKENDQCCNNNGGCQVFPQTSDENIDEDHLIVHGVKVEDKRVTSSSDNSNDKSQPPLVMLHGYANGCLYFYRNLVDLSQTHFPTIHALDMLGWGLSSRPKFETTPDNTSVESAEAFFVESLEAWREKNRIDKMMLAGHSMGGYISVAYAEKYPERVERLILLSPVGVPENKIDELVNQVDTLPFTTRTMIKTVRYLFDKGITPQSFLRSLPESRSKQLVESYVERRLPSITCPEERSVLSKYLHHNAMLPGSGEHCLSRILNPGAFAKKPLLHRIPHLNVSNIHFLYGQNDWMDAEGGLSTQKICHEKRQKGENAPEVVVYGVKDAGHLLMLENPDEFNSACIMAGGGGHKLSPDAPRPTQFEHTGKSHESFFRGGRGFRRKSQAEKQQNEDGGKAVETVQTS